MDRIANPKSYEAVYFQHGYMDSGLAWILHGQADSIGFVAVDCDHRGIGFDVFAGNLRGMHPRKTVREKIDYWEYCIDDFAIYDIPAFLEKIIEVKTKELR
jgi:lysosomal acid lipase/cholesteryl ester hydrolase